MCTHCPRRPVPLHRAAAHAPRPGAARRRPADRDGTGAPEPGRQGSRRARRLYRDADGPVPRRAGGLRRAVLRRGGAAAKHLDREIHDGENKASLPGRPVRSEGAGADRRGRRRRRLRRRGRRSTTSSSTSFGRDSLDGQGLKLASTVHHRRQYNNAFWDGSQMAYGDGDGQIFSTFIETSVIGHEMSHGVVQFSGGLTYQGQSGALNESFADCFGALVRQKKEGSTGACESDWLIGKGILGPEIHGAALRSMQGAGTAYDDALLGQDPQPYHMDLYVSTTETTAGCTSTRAFRTTPSTLCGADGRQLLGRAGAGVVPDDAAAQQPVRELHRLGGRHGAGGAWRSTASAAARRWSPAGPGSWSGVRSDRRGRLSNGRCGGGVPGNDDHHHDLGRHRRLRPRQEGRGRPSTRLPEPLRGRGLRAARPRAPSAPSTHAGPRAADRIVYHIAVTGDGAAAGQLRPARVVAARRDARSDRRAPRSPAGPRDARRRPDYATRRRGFRRWPGCCSCRRSSTSWSRTSPSP